MADANDHIIRVSDLTVGFGERLVLEKLSLDVRKGEILGFVGPSGAGKSVLMRTIIGLMPKRSGRIEVMGVDLGAVTAVRGATWSAAGASCFSRVRCSLR